ncbi:MAG: hypothetical protein OEY78_11985 [Gammaproteobacteria bacterium]|nr:hypothetical protein [Gammaproteobacteria bacterium]
MAQQITWTSNINIGGSKIFLSGEQNIEGVDSVMVDLAGTDTGSADTDREVEIQPGGAGQVKFLAISASDYGADISYKINNSGATAITLEEPLILIGENAVNMFDAAPSSLFFTNNFTSNVTISVVVGRDATPTP